MIWTHAKNYFDNINIDLCGFQFHDDVNVRTIYGILKTYFSLFGLKSIKFKDTEQLLKILSIQVKNVLYAHLSAFNQYQQKHRGYKQYLVMSFLL